MARLHRDDEAVSPVIATVLLLAITVMLSGMVFVLMQGALQTTEKAPPQMTVSVRSLDNGYHVIRITTLDQTLDPGRISFNLQEQGSNGNGSFTGFVNDGMSTRLLVPTFRSMTVMQVTQSRLVIILWFTRKPLDRMKAPGRSHSWMKAYNTS